MFRVITRKLVERKNKKRQETSQDRNKISSQRRAQGPSDVQGSFKLTNKRQSWLGIASAPGIASGDETDHGVQGLVENSKGKCC